MLLLIPHSRRLTAGILMAEVETPSFRQRHRRAVGTAHPATAIPNPACKLLRVDGKAILRKHCWASSRDVSLGGSDHHPSSLPSFSVRTPPKTYKSRRSHGGAERSSGGAHAETGRPVRAYPRIRAKTNKKGKPSRTAHRYKANPYLPTALRSAESFTLPVSVVFRAHFPPGLRLGLRSPPFPFR